MQHINWDNLRYVLTVANKGSISGAARELGVNRSTVLRRIDAFQKSLDCRIFERSGSGYTLTVEAEKMIAAAREVESTLYNMQREIAGAELRLDGELSITTTNTFMVQLMGPVFASFHIAHPQILINVIVTDSVLDLNRRDADVAIRPTKVPEPPLIGSKIRDIEFGVYASQKYLQRTDAKHWREYEWIGLDSSFLPTPPGKWFSTTVPNSRISLRADSFVTVKVAAENDFGAALLPRFVADDSNYLERLAVPTEELTTGLWALTHPDMIRSARVHAFMDHVRSALN